MTLSLLAFGVVIALNNLALSLTLGALDGRRHWRRILSVFAVFEFTVPLIGVWLGREIAQAMAADLGWLGPVILAGLGITTLLSLRADRRDRAHLVRAMTSWRGLAALSAGLSTDNLMVGFGLGLGGVSPLALATTIMVCSVSFAAIGLQVGHRVSRDYERPALAVSGVALIGLAAASALGWL
ncbi:manganese efflux pump MntP [Roseovarius nitratireducens]|uniref:manganese efflux pump MntP n=1 Tax=Roseovarius nitratireducens TaxID=2044597 RepID=UPI000CE1EE37|nr:manganese efflux pump [Roseovarius nitratireducens]